MSDRSEHLSDEVILQFIDNELPAKRLNRIREHLAGCPDCRTRKLSIESASAALAELYSSEPLGTSPGATLPRLWLQKRLVQSRHGFSFPLSRMTRHSFGLPATAALLAIMTIFAFHQAGFFQFTRNARAVSDQQAFVPNHALTPGAVRPVTLAEVCSADDRDLDPKVSPSIEKTVFEEYGLQAVAKPANYQIDYLVNPQLGGTGDIKNLWPEPSSHGIWNAQAKDDLERHLHRMVCDRHVDLALAQQEIATDWIAAYKKYMGHQRS